MQNNLIRNKTVVVTGGTGSIGSEVFRRVLLLSPKEVRIFSRDEYKQHQLKLKYNKYKNVKYIIGDVRDLESVMTVTRGADIIFHVAALKHVPISEEMPEEFVKTNIKGALNIKKSALANNVPLVVAISSDKAVDSSNVMGFTKAIQEKVFISHFLQNKEKSSTKFIIVRFGNVNGTKGSLFPIIYHQLKNNLPITITNPKMTRFFMSPDEAVDLIFWAAANGKQGEIIIKRMKAAEIGRFIERFIKNSGIKASKITNIGIRVGEKMHESLISEVELSRMKEKSGYYIISPYTHSQIEENILTTRPDIQKRMELFRSDCPQNDLSDSEIDKYCCEYVKNCNGNSQII